MISSHAWRLCICIVLGLLCCVACGGDDTAKKSGNATSPSSPQATLPPGAAPRVIEVTVAFVAPRFRPDPIVLQVGEPVQFKITSADTRHTVVIEPLGIEVEVPQKSLNDTVTTQVVTPREVGQLRIFCRLHERLPMEGTLEVTATGAASN